MTTKIVPGTCYEDAWRFAIKQEEGDLIHGTVLSEGKRIGHAWVELPSGYIWEPQTGKYFTPEAFQIAASPIEEHRYTTEEAAMMAIRASKHGPWSDEERRQFLKRSGNPGVTPEVTKAMSVEEVSRLETRLPLKLLWKDEATYMDRLTTEIQEKGITEPVTIRVREDGSQIVWDGLHRLAVAQKLGIKDIPVQYIGEVGKLAILKASGNPGFTAEEAKSIGKELGIDFKRYDVEQFRQGLDVELEHCNVTNCDPLLTGKIAQAHLNELPDYYTRLAKMEEASRKMKYKVDDIKVTLKYERPGVHLVIIEPPGGRPITEEEGKKITKLIEEKTSESGGDKKILERLGRGQTVNELMPMPPESGPPLPRGWGVKWPWKK